MGKYFGHGVLVNRVGSFPQGGIDDGESPEQAMYRELYEEVGLRPHQVELIYTSRTWYRYRLPKRFFFFFFGAQRDASAVGGFIGQKQKWFLLKLTCDESGCGRSPVWPS